jgi:trigger factor
VETSVEKISNLERRIKVSIPAEEIDKKTMQKLESMKGEIKIAGFRPGKVPLSVIKQRFGNSARNEVIADAIRDSYFEVLTQENLHPAGQPHIEPSESKFGEPLKYSATFEILPEITLANMDGVKVEKLSSEVTDKDVEDMLQKLLKQHANWTEVDREAKKADQLVIDFEGKIKDESFKGGSAKDFKFELGAGMMLSDFEKPLIKAKAGEIKKFKLKFPADYTDTNVAGKKAEFEVTVHKVLEA